METPPTPCQVEPQDLWFSDDAAEQRKAAKLCEGCPLSRYHMCREEGWNHEHGVWGGLTPVMRKRMDRRRYEAAVGAAEARSLEIDDTVVDLNARVHLDRILEAAREAKVQTVFELDGPDVATMLALEL